jgi:hypothetical protein
MRPATSNSGSSGPHHSICPAVAAPTVTGAVDLVSLGSGNDQRIRRHRIAHAQTADMGVAPDLLPLLAGRSGYEPPDQGEPDAADPATSCKEIQEPNRDEEKATGGANPGRNRRGTQSVTPSPPQHRSQDPPAIEREGRKQVEGSEQRVDPRKPSQRGDQKRADAGLAQQPRGHRRDSRYRQAGGWTSGGYLKLGTSAGRVAAQLGDAADANSVAARVHATRNRIGKRLQFAASRIPLTRPRRRLSFIVLAQARRT